jgi:hypothetical protein
MNIRATADSPLNIVALGWGLSAALVVLFVICLAAALVFPGLASLARMDRPVFCRTDDIRSGLDRRHCL